MVTDSHRSDHRQRSGHCFRRGQQQIALHCRGVHQRFEPDLRGCRRIHHHHRTKLWSDPGDKLGHIQRDSGNGYELEHRGSIVVTVPTGATTGNVVVTVGGLASNGSPFTVVPPPSITQPEPNFQGAVGVAVTITGSNFGATQGTSKVAFNGTTATVTSWSATSIVVTVPTGATTGNVVVTVLGTASNGSAFTIILPPSITSLSQLSGTIRSFDHDHGELNFGAATQEAAR